MPRKIDDCLLELRWMYDRRDLAEVQRDLAAWLAKWGGKYPKLTGWVEDNIEEMLTYFRLPLAHRKHMEPTNVLERSTKRSGGAPPPSLASASLWASERRRLRGDGSTGSDPMIEFAELDAHNSSSPRCHPA